MTRPPLTDQLLDRVDGTLRDRPTALAQQLEDWAARRATETGDDVPPDARCYLVDALLAAGRVDEADAVAGELRRAHGDDTFVLLFLGESYQERGHLAEAHRWSMPTPSSTTSRRTVSTSPPRRRP